LRAPHSLAVSTANPSSPAPPTPYAATRPSPTPSPAPDSLPSLTAPPPATLRYEVTVQARGLTTQGEGRLDWRHDGHSYALRLALSGGSLPSQVQTSRGQLSAQGLAPDYFHARARGEQATHFDREAGRVVFSANRPQAALAEGMQDRLSVLMQLAMLLAADPARFPEGARIALPTAGSREAGEWVFQVGGPEDLVLPGGRVAAVKLERPPRSAYDQRIEVWLAPGQAYAPVRLRLTNPDGGAVDQRWASTDRD
jgi:hypothetical protein